ncbi:MAG TPA: beta-galactosidase [Candidatus Fimimorpha excrementavium]|nr:beta-galactosidase [Candidatus Fimimorpha excrementavium]
MDISKQKNKCWNLDQITLGTCYYPEHWDSSLWRDDLIRMKEHGIQVVRIAEFAWNKFEPREGEFTIGWFDPFMKIAEEEGISVIFCTPTATPPAWLTEKYPEVLNADAQGLLYRHGLRRHYNYTSPKYWELSRRLIHKLAVHYCSYSNVIGWQLDNEINCEMAEFHAESDHKAFRDYMRMKFETLDNLNEKMGTTFWNQTYTDWEEIHLRRHTVGGFNNPHMELEGKRFISYAAYAFLKMQAEAIRPYLKEDQFITTNGIFPNVDYQRLVPEVLDFITYDNYPDFAYGMDANPRQEGNLKDRNSSFNLARVRSISPVFGIMEQQSGPGGWTGRILQPMPKPGQMRLWTMQAIAHGADYIGYFRWRTCGYGTEIYWHGLNDYSNGPNRRLEELKTIHEETVRLSDAGLAGARYQANYAILRDYDNDWDGAEDKMYGPLADKSMDGWFRAFQHNHIPFDFYYWRDETTAEELGQYEILIYPHPAILTRERADILMEYMKNGGTVIFGSRTGYKDEYGRCPMRPMPGFAGELCGVRVKDYTLLGPDDDMEYVSWEGDRMEAPWFNDVLEQKEGGEILAVFQNNYYDGEPALIRKQNGKGWGYYFGGGFSEDTANGFIQKLGMKPVRGVSHVPAEVEAALRSKTVMIQTDGTEVVRNYLFLLNYTKEEKTVELENKFEDVLSGETLTGQVKLPGYGVVCLMEEER